MDIYNNFLKQVILKSRDPGMPRGRRAFEDLRVHLGSCRVKSSEL